MKNLATALLKAQKSMGVALKDSKNPFFKSKYADLNSVIDASLSVLNDAGIVVLQPVTVLDGKQYVETKLIHADSGESISSLTEVIVKSSNDAQQAGAGITYARRFGLQALVVLKAEDDDGNLATGKTNNVPLTNVTTAIVPSVKTVTATEVIASVEKISNETILASAPPKFVPKRAGAARVTSSGI